MEKKEDIKNKARIWRAFPLARAFVHTLGLKSSGDWWNYCKSGKRPPDIPSFPKRAYPSEYKDMGDWLGTGNIAPTKRVWRPFPEARAYIHTLKLKNTTEWEDYCKSGKKPSDIPSNPHHVYRPDFKGYGDWLGTGTVASFKHCYRPFAEARAFVHTLNLKNTKEWRIYCKSGKKPDDIPTMPERYGSDFKGYGDWLGTGNIASGKQVWRPFPEARAYVRSLHLKSYDEWLAYCRSGKKPADIPATPDDVYLAEFESFGDWLGTGKIASSKRVWRPFPEARAFVHTLGLKSYRQWEMYCTSGKKPADIPSHPSDVYRSEYKDIGDWLGTGRTLHYRPFLEARAFTRTLGLKSYKQWIEYCRSGKKPVDIPSYPQQRYRGEYKTIEDWLGIEYLSFSEVRAFVRTLHLKNQHDWLNYCRSSKKPSYVPSKPDSVYRSEYKGIKDWLGVVDKWNNATLLAFLHDLQPQLGHLDKRDLVAILEQDGILIALRKVLGGTTARGATPRRVLNDLMQNKGKELEQALRNALDDNIMTPTDGITGENATVKVFENEANNVPFGQYSLHMENTSDISVNRSLPMHQETFDGDATQLSQRQEQNQPTEPIVNKRNLSDQLQEVLLTTFDDLYTTKDVQRRGYQLQDLLNLLFQLQGIDVQKSFTRNEGGEQIDGAFRLHGWHYLVECRWRAKLADIRQLDGLYGQVERSGRQTMGLFLSINGWSENVCQLLKQNVSKSIILMDGDDLRGVLSGHANLQDFLEAKIARLNLANEPFFGLNEYLEKVRTKRKGIL